jgi:hypothetical protein
MPQRLFKSQLYSSFYPAGQEQPSSRDIAWDRPIFRAPGLDLPNPRVVFDPPPFRTQLFSAARRVYRLARR